MQPQKPEQPCWHKTNNRKFSNEIRQKLFSNSFANWIFSYELNWHLIWTSVCFPVFFDVTSFRTSIKSLKHDGNMKSFKAFHPSELMRGFHFYIIQKKLSPLEKFMQHLCWTVLLVFLTWSLSGNGNDDVYTRRDSNFEIWRKHKS